MTEYKCLPGKCVACRQWVFDLPSHTVTCGALADIFGVVSGPGAVAVRRLTVTAGGVKLCACGHGPAMKRRSACTACHRQYARAYRARTSSNPRPSSPAGR